MVTAGTQDRECEGKNREQFPASDQNCKQSGRLLCRVFLSLSLLVFTTIARGTG